MHKSLLIVLAAAALPSLASAAPAKVEVSTVAVDVAYSDLALDKRAGAETLTRRVEAAVNSVCDRPVTMRDLKAMLAWENCRTAARSQAQAQLAPVVAYTKAANVDRF